MSRVYQWDKNFSRRKIVIATSNQVNYHQRLLWEQEAKECGFPLKLEEKQCYSGSKSWNAMWYDKDWNERSSLNRCWKSQRKVKKQWMRGIK